MGSAFLSQPITTKHQHGRVRVVSCEMQGWRKYMKDAIHFKQISKDIFLFAVFDGHGGVEVSHLCADHFPQYSKTTLLSKEENMNLHLNKASSKIDSLLGSEEGEQKLKIISAEKGMQPFQNSKVAEFVGCTAKVALLVTQGLRLRLRPDFIIQSFIRLD